jgi:hypothetical protein
MKVLRVWDAGEAILAPLELKVCNPVHEMKMHRPLHERCQRNGMANKSSILECKLKRWSRDGTLKSIGPAKLTH